MPRSLQESLAKLQAGDVIHGTSNQGHSLILLVLSSAPDAVVCRQITSGDTLRFSQVTGQEIGRPDTWIDSIYPLPREFHDAFMDMDRTFRCVDVDLYPTGCHLTQVQKRALLFIDDFYRTHPVSGPLPVGQEEATDAGLGTDVDRLLKPFELR